MFPAIYLKDLVKLSGKLKTLGLGLCHPPKLPSRSQRVCFNPMWLPPFLMLTAPSLPSESLSSWLLTHPQQPDSSPAIW